jgi:fluoride exporter
MIAIAFLVAAAAGALLRSEIGRKLNPLHPVPLGTLLVNASGSFALGATASIAPPLLTILGTGLLGTFTTVSSFARDVAALIETRQFRSAIVYFLASASVPVGFAWLGILLGGAV